MSCKGKYAGCASGLEGGTGVPSDGSRAVEEGSLCGLTAWNPDRPSISLPSGGPVAEAASAMPHCKSCGALLDSEGKCKNLMCNRFDPTREPVAVRCGFCGWEGTLAECRFDDEEIVSVCPKCGVGTFDKVTLGHLTRQVGDRLDNLCKQAEEDGAGT